MINDILPSIFISHGAPTLPMEDVPAKRFLVELGRKYRDVEAVLCISAHWETTIPTINITETHGTLHDFYGFQPELYEITYPAHGKSEFAEYAYTLIKDAGVECALDDQRGLDHGVWVPMSLMFPDAEMPVFQLSIQQDLDPKKHYALGQTLESLRQEGILILGSGGAVHPLGYAPLRPGAKTDKWALEFDAWLTKTITDGDSDGLIDYRNCSPYSERAHPYPDHFMPLIATMGAAGEGARGTLIHHSWYWGDLGMGAYEFNP